MEIVTYEDILKGDDFPLNTIIHAHCLQVLRYIPTASVDLILCGLPYGTTNAPWDTPIDLPLLWMEYKRIIKANGAILLYVQTPFDKVLGASNIEMLKYEWIWEKSQATGFFNCRKAPLKAHENILVFYKDAPIYNPQKTEGHRPVNKFTKKLEAANRSEIYGKGGKDITGEGNTDRYPRSVLRFASDKQTNKLNGTSYSAQKPLLLNEYFIKTYTNEGGIVLDNAAGSFTTCIAADKLKRSWIGIDNVYNACLIGQKRFKLLNK